MKVKLLSKTGNLLETIYTSARTCYNAGSPIDDFENNEEISREDKIKLVKKILRSGHTSIAEHANFTFAVEGISRACSHQLVRHRHATFSHQSQRYVKFDKPIFYEPNSIIHNREADAIYNNFLNIAKETYNKLIELDINAEDARYVLPNATCSNISFTMNLRELMHFSGLRLCSRAQKEIRDLTREMVKEVVTVEEWTKDLLVPKCEFNGFCDEFKSCGRKIKKEDLIKNELS